MAEEDATTTTTTTTEALHPSFPTGRIKKIMKLDKDISKVNSDALFLVSLSTDLFLRFLADRSAQAALDRKRKTIKLEHIRAAVKMHQPTAEFLLDSLPMPPPAQQQLKKAASEENPVEKTLPRGTQRIDQFFKKGV